MSTLLSLGPGRQAAASASQRLDKQSPSGSLDSGYKLETSTDDANNCTSDESQTSSTCAYDYNKDSAVYSSRITQTSKLHGLNDSQPSVDLPCLQFPFQNGSGRAPNHEGPTCTSSVEKALPLDLRQNPRRSGQSRDSNQVAAPQLPCTLRRGAVKRDCFVTRLVSTYQLASI